MKIATLAIIRDGSRVLLGHKIGSPEIGRGTLNGPGGKQEPGETLLECLARECDEELGIAIDGTRVEKAAIITFHIAGLPTFLVHVYEVLGFSGEPRATAHMIPYWFESVRIPYERMLESDAHWFPKVLAGENFCANVYYARKGEHGPEGFENIEFFPFRDTDE